MSSLVSPVYGEIRTQIGTGATAVQIDVLVAENYNRSSTITDHPVEDGSEVSDNKQQKPDTLQLTAFFAQSLANADDQNAATVTRAEDLYDKLLDLEAAAEPLSIFTARREYSNMMIERVTRPRTAADGDGVTVTVDFKQIKIATSQVVAAPPTRQRKNPKRDQGKRPKKAANENQKELSSLARDGWRAATGG